MNKGNQISSMAELIRQKNGKEITITRQRFLKLPLVGPIRFGRTKRKGVLQVKNDGNRIILYHPGLENGFFSFEKQEPTYIRIG